METAFNYSGQTVARVGLIANGTVNGTDTYGFRFLGQNSSDSVGLISMLNDVTAWVSSSSHVGSNAPALQTNYSMNATNNGGTWSGTLYSGYGIDGSSLRSLSTTNYTTANNLGATAGYAARVPLFTTAQESLVICKISMVSDEDLST